MKSIISAIVLNLGPLLLSGSSVEILRQSNPLDVAWLSVPDATKTQMRSGYDFNDGNYDSGNLLRVEPAGV